MDKTYRMTIAGLERELPLFKVADNLCIAAFIMFGDVEMTKACASELLKKAPEHDVIVTAECKSLPLVYEMARQSNNDNYIVCRKAPKVYMKDVITTEVNSITTVQMQKLCIGEDEINSIRGKKVVIIDDVISTGDSLEAIEYLVNKAGGNVVGKMAVLAEGDAIDRQDIIVLEPLPLFNEAGTVK